MVLEAKETQFELIQVAVQYKNPREGPHSPILLEFRANRNVSVTRTVNTFQSLGSQTTQCDGTTWRYRI